MNILKKIYNYNFAQVCLLLFMVTSLFLPVTKAVMNAYNSTFILPVVFLTMFTILEIIDKGRAVFEKSPKYIYVLVFYMAIFMIYNIFLYPKYMPMIHKTIIFLFIYILFEKYMINKDNFEFVFNWLVILFTITILLSVILYFVMDYDQIYIEWGHIYVRRVSETYENRLTYVFAHKSEYGLLLNAFLIVCLRFKQIKLRWPRILLILLTLILTNSMISIGGALLILVAFWFDYEIKKTGWKSKKILAAIILMIVGGIGFTYFVSTKRNIGTLGNRIPVWTWAVRSLYESPMGMDEKFFSYAASFVYNNAGDTVYASNFHNIFFNEAGMYSIPVAAVFTVLFLWRFALKLKNNFEWVDLAYFLGLFITMIFDQAISDASLAILLLFMGLGFYYKENKDVIE